MKNPSFSYPFARPSVTVDCVIFGLDQSMDLQVLLIRRGVDPFAGCWALPGGFVEVSDNGGQGEDLEAAARRELEEETGAKVSYLEQLYTFGKPGRDPRGRVISVAYMALVRADDHAVKGGDDAAEARWVPVSSLDGMKKSLAFDHAEILAMAKARLQAKVLYAPIGFNLLPATFGAGDLVRLYEVTLGRPIDRRNFLKRILATGILREVGVREGGKGRPAKLYRFDARAYEKATREGLNFTVWGGAK